MKTDLIEFWRQANSEQSIDPACFSIEDFAERWEAMKTKDKEEIGDLKMRVLWYDDGSNLNVISNTEKVNIVECLGMLEVAKKHFIESKLKLDNNE